MFTTDMERMCSRFSVFYGLLLCTALVWAQTNDRKNTFKLLGSVTVKETDRGIPGYLSIPIRVPLPSPTLGGISTGCGHRDMLQVEGPGFETVRYRIQKNEPVYVKITGYDASYLPRSKAGRGDDVAQLHQRLLDSASFYKEKDISRSIGFVANAITLLGRGADDILLARSLRTLGDIYYHHKQYDLAIENYEDAQKARMTIATALALARAYLATKPGIRPMPFWPVWQAVPRYCPCKRFCGMNTWATFKEERGSLLRPLVFIRKGCSWPQ